MQFRNFIWPNEPSSLRVTSRRRTALLEEPGGGWTLQDLGTAARTVTGEGVFFGETAYESLRTLEALLAQGGAGRTWRSSGRTPVRSLTDNATSPKCPAGRSARVTAGRHGANPGAGPDSDSATGRISLRPQASGSERFAPGR